MLFIALFNNLLLFLLLYSIYFIFIKSFSCCFAFVFWVVPWCVSRTFFVLSVESYKLGLKHVFLYVFDILNLCLDFLYTLYIIMVFNYIFYFWHECFTFLFITHFYYFFQSSFLDPSNFWLSNNYVFFILFQLNIKTFRKRLISTKFGREQNICFL